MLGVLRFEVADEDDFLPAAREALAVLAARPGFRSGRLARAYDQPTQWCLVTEWESVGAYRRALGSFEVRSTATPLLSRALPEPSAYEPLVTVDVPGRVGAQGSVDTWGSDPGGTADPGGTVAAGRPPGELQTRESDRGWSGRSTRKRQDAPSQDGLSGDPPGPARPEPSGTPAPTTDTDSIAAWGRSSGVSGER